MTRFPIGTRFVTRGKHPRECVVIDILTTRNAAGEVVRERYLAEHHFMGQIITDEVPETTVAMGVAAMAEG